MGGPKIARVGVLLNIFFATPTISSQVIADIVSIIFSLHKILPQNITCLEISKARK
ncbi:hypothetical protein FXW22_01595 [Candidatus Liberibacter asiaticus]|nr:hypothetical protein FXW22_01595 [Candidatus Liberibacter asiaticus]